MRKCKQTLLIAVQAVTGPVEKNITPVKPLSAKRTGTKSPEVTTFPNLAEINGIGKNGFLEEVLSFLRTNTRRYRRDTCIK